MLAFAAEQGADVDQKPVEKVDIETIVSSKHILTTRALSEAEESAFWDAYRNLCTATYPVSRESLEATTIQPKSRMLLGTVYVSVARSAVRNYQTVTIVSLVVLLIFQIYWVFVSTIVTDINNVRNEIIEMKVAVFAKKGELSIIDGKLGREYDQSGEYDEETEKLYFKLRSEYEQLQNDSELRSDNLNYQYRSNISLLAKVNIVGNWFILDETDETQETEDINSLLIQTGSITLEIMSLYLLPILYGLVGACAYILRNISQQIKLRTFTSALKIRLQLRMVLGALAGLSIAWFVKGEGGVSFIDNITPLALAFLAGYSVELLFSAMDTFIAAFSRDRHTE